MHGKSRSDGEPDHQRLDVVIDLLAIRRRRHALIYLAHESDGVVDLDALAQYVRERDGSRGPDVDRRAVSVALHHADLPRLADEGIVEYDSDRNLVHYLGSPLAERLLPAVEPRETTTR